MRVYKIFLASSEELASERIAFGDKIQEINDSLIAQKKQVHFTLNKWERDSNSFANRRKQDDYNEFIENCDIFLMLYWTKVGKYTEEEFDFSYNRFLKTCKPVVFVYQKIAHGDVEPSVKDFQEKTLGQHQQFTPKFENADSLGVAFANELQKLFANGTLASAKAETLFGIPNDLPETLISRKKDLEAIQHFFDDEDPNISKKELLIYSEGGVGKTTLAVQYWHQNQYKYNYCAWLFCKNGIVKGIESLAVANGQSFSEIAGEHKDAVILKYLNNLSNQGKCLLVLDNVDEQQHLQVWRDRFGGLQWDVLITSRLNEVTKHELHLRSLYPEDAVDLFYFYYRRENRSDAKSLIFKLVQHLKYNTLLVEIFAKNLEFAFQANGENIYSFYLKFEKKGLSVIDDAGLVDTKYTGNVHRETSTPHHVLEFLYDISVLPPEDKNLLQLLALLPAANYSISLLLALFGQKENTAFLSSLKRLNPWMLVDKDGVQLSSLVQEVILFKTGRNPPTGYGSLVKKLSELIDEENQPLIDIIKTYLPIAEGVILSYAKIKSAYSTTIFNLILDVEYANRTILNLSGHTEVDYELMKAYIVREEAGDGHKSSLLEAYMLFAERCHKLYKFEEALYYQQLVIQIKKEYPKDGKGITKALEKAGAICYDWNMYGNSVEYYYEAYETHKEVYPANSLSEASWQNKYGMALRGLGGHQNLEHAKTLLNHVLKYYTEKDPAVARVRSNLALVLIDLGGENNLQEAKALLEKALHSDIENYTEKHPTVATARSNLAYVLKNLGGEENLQEAKALLAKALQSDIENDTEKHPTVALTRANLAIVLQNLGGEENLLDAKFLLENALQSGIETYTEKHPIVSIGRSNLAMVLRDLGGKENLQAAKILLENALQSHIENYTKKHPEVAIKRSNLAIVLQDLGGVQNLQVAKPLFEKALQSDIESYTEKHPVVAIRRSNLATLLHGLGGEENLFEAKALLVKAVQSDIESYTEKHPTVATGRSNLAIVLKDLGGEENLFEAKALLEKAVQSDIESYTEKHATVAIRRSNLAAVLKVLGGEGNLLEAKALLEKAVLSIQISLGIAHTTTTIICDNLEDVKKELSSMNKNATNEP